MAEWITDTITRMGYGGIVLLMFLENVFPPTPSELIMPFAGMVAGRGNLSLVGVILAGTLGSLLGALPLYYLGWKIGEERLRDWADRHGHWLAVDGSDITRAREWFERHGNRIVFLSRMVPAIRSLISIPAGADRMPMGTFLVLSALGQCLWCALLAYLGSILGQNYRQIERFLDPVTYAVFALIGGLFLWRILRRQFGAQSPDKSRRRSPAA